jgi:hypothetical protein
MSVTAASLTTAGQSIDLTLTESPSTDISVSIPDGLVKVGASALLPSGLIQYDAPSSSFTLDVTAASLTAVGQGVAFNLTMPVEASTLTVVGQSVELTGTNLVLATSPADASGGWATTFRHEQDAFRRAAQRRREEEQRERAEKAALASEIAALEQHLVEQGTLAKVSPDTELLRLSESADNMAELPRRAERAMAYAERARTEAAVALAQRELARAMEEEEVAVLMTLAMLD